MFEENIEEVKQQHMDRNTKFLYDELKLMDQGECKDHVFFVSAREALAQRLKDTSGTPTPCKYHVLYI